MKNLMLCLPLLFVLPLQAQQKIISLETSDTIINATVDRPGDLYLISKEGQIQKYDKDGKLLVVFKHKGPPTLFDPRDGARLFAYYRENQQYEYYNPSFGITASYKIDPAFAIQPWLMCPSGDHKLWILDKADNSLKKINAQHTEVELEVLIDSTVIKDASLFTAIREYQGFVFILNPKKGIDIFNSLGIHIKNIKVEGINHFNFLGEELYYLKDNQVTFFNLFSAENRSLSLEKASRLALFTDERKFLIGYRWLDILEYKP